MLSRLRFALALATVMFLPCSAQKFDEFQVKAAFICNFPNFIEWPATAYRNSADPFDICVLGQNPFGETLEKLSSGRTTNGRSLRVRRVKDAHSASACQILFISSSERLRFRSIFSDLKVTSVLAVGDTNDFISEGGIVALRVESGKVRIEINAQRAKEKNLRIDSHLLDLARIGN